MRLVHAVLTGAAMTLCGGVVLGQGGQSTATVSGQVRILERPGETTEDLGDVVVFLDGANTSRVHPATTNSVMNLQGRQFVPRVRVVTGGSRVEFANQDPFSHNVFSKMNGGFDTGVYGRNRSKENVFADPGVYPLYCNIHPRMTAFVITLNTPYYVQAGADGRFALPNVPPGQYTMHVWHDRAPQVDQPITVTAAGLSNLTVEMDARGYRYVQHKNKFGQDYTSTSGDRY
jgi:plastocyanin